MIPLWQQDLERGLLIATILMCSNLAIGFITTFVSQSLLIAVTAGNLGFLELGILLIVGGCLMSRQPIDETARYTKDGTPTTAWKMTRIGRQLLFAALILFVYIGLLSILSYLVPI